MSPHSTQPRDAVEAPHLTFVSILLVCIVVASVVVAASVSGLNAVVAVTVISVILYVSAFRLAVVQPITVALATLAGASLRSSNRVVELEARVAALQAERERERRKVSRLGGILAATQHELNREITMLGFAVDDVVDEASGPGPLPAEIDALKIALDHVEEGQRNVSALSRLGTGDTVDKIEAFSASDIAPLTLDAAVSIERNDPIYGDVDLWRLFVKNAVRNSEAHGRASVITLSTGQGRLIIADDGLGCTGADLEQSWTAGLRPNGTRSDGTQIMRRIAEAHGAAVDLWGEPGAGVRIEVDLRDLELDLRDRGAIEARIVTPHKASGGRISSSSS